MPSNVELKGRLNSATCQESDFFITTLLLTPLILFVLILSMSGETYRCLGNFLWRFFLFLPEVQQSSVPVIPCTYYSLFQFLKDILAGV